MPSPFDTIAHAHQIAQAEYDRLISLGMSDEAANRIAEREYGGALFTALVNANLRFPSVESHIRYGRAANV